MAKIINLTPHAIVLQKEDGERIQVQPSGTVATVATMPATLHDIPGIPVPVAAAPEYGEVEKLPDPQDGTIYIVSGIVLSRCPGRTDVFGPGTGPKDGAIREDGRVVAVTRLIAAPPAKSS